MNTGFSQARSADLGTLMRATLANLAAMRRPLAVYMGAVVILALAGPQVNEAFSGVFGLALYLAAQYWLFRTLLKTRGLLVTPQIHGFAFFALAALLILPILFGLALLVLPGLFLAARWIAAPAFVVARGDGAFAAAGASWQAVRGSTGPVIGVIVLAVIAISVLGGVLNALIGGMGEAIALPGLGRLAKPSDVIEAQLVALVLFALSVATYDLVGPRDRTIEEVFG